MIVEEQSEPQQPFWAQPCAMRQHQPQRPDDVRGDAPQHLALDQGLADEAKLMVLEIAQTTVD